MLFSTDGPAYRMLYLLIAAAIFLGQYWWRRDWYDLALAVLLAASLAPKPWIGAIPWAWTMLTGASLLFLLAICLVAGVMRVIRIRTATIARSQ